MKTGFFVPVDGSARGVIVYDNGLCDGVLFSDCVWNWEVELTRRFPQVFLVTEASSAFRVRYAGPRAEPTCESMEEEGVSAIDILRAVWIRQTPRFSLQGVFGMSYASLFDALFDG